MLGFFKRKRIGGEIAYYGLQDWWLNTFTSEEQAYIVRKFQPLGTGNSSSLITGSISWKSSGSIVSFLCGLSGWFNNPQDRHISVRILNKAEELSKPCRKNTTGTLSKQEASSIFDEHLLYHQIIKTYYPERNSNPNAFKKAISACQDQIALAPLTKKAYRKKWKGEPLPRPTGYEQLAIVLEKQKKFQEALTLCKEALKAKWGGDWKKRIERLDKKLKKLKVCDQ